MIHLMNTNHRHTGAERNVLWSSKYAQMRWGAHDAPPDPYSTGNGTPHPYPISILPHSAKGATPSSKLGGFNSLVYGITTLLCQKKLDKSTQFGAVDCIITLYSPKSYVKSWRSVQRLGSRPSRPPSGCAHAFGARSSAPSTLPVNGRYSSFPFQLPFLRLQK